jgi:eukaryotic-like serine/threonine-protein kinase
MLQNLGQGEQQIKIIDFGIAKIKNSVIAPSTAANVAAGTVAYMAPEQLSGRPVSAVTDVYALGAITYEMLTGRKPFNPETGFELLEMQRGGVRIKPSDLRPSLSAYADQLILKAISFEPSHRPTKARDFGDDLARALNASLETAEYRPSTRRELLPTQMATEATPLAAKPGTESAKAIGASFPISSQVTFDKYSASPVSAEKEKTPHLEAPDDHAGRPFQCGAASLRRLVWIY